MEQYLLLLLTLFAKTEQCELLTERTLDALEKAINFVYDDCRDFNVDGVFGVALAEAHLDMILKSNSTVISRSKVEEIRLKACKTRELSKVYLPDRPFKYWVFKNFIAVPSIWKRQIPYAYGRLDQYNRPPFEIPFSTVTTEGFLDYINNSTFSEDESDRCLVEVAAPGIHKPPHKCFISNHCRRIIFSEPDSTYQAYGATHKLLYLQVAVARNCTFNKHFLNKKIVELCSYIFWEAENIRRFNFPPNLTDLFFEQLVLCGYEGFEEFFNTEYLLFALNAQCPSGSFSNTPFENRRKRRESNRMVDGGSSHTTGLGISLLASFLRYFAEM